MAEINIHSKWKGISTSFSISKDPIIGMVYSGRKNRGKGQGGDIVGVLIETYPDKQDAILRDRQDFPHCVEYNSLKIIINE